MTIPLPPDLVETGFMPRMARNTPGGLVYHVLNRAAGKRRMFELPGDFADFLNILGETQERLPMRILAFCIMPNHWHLVVWPETDNSLSPFMQRLTTTHVRRWKQYRDDIGLGPLYQGRYKSFPVHTDAHLLVLIRYVEANALRAGLVSRAEDWHFGSLASQETALRSSVTLSPWPIPRPSNWAVWVNEDWSKYHLDRISECTRKSRPFGPSSWTQRTADELGLASSLRERGRPKKTILKR
jgi:putative transposase